MKVFWKEHSYHIVKLFVNQIGLSVFGLVLFTAAVATNNQVFILIASIFSTLFYLALVYSMVWEIGAKDKIRLDAQRLVYDKYTGLKIGLMASIPNIILVFILNVSYFLGNIKTGLGLEWAGNIYLIANAVLRLIMSFLTGINVYILPESPNVEGAVMLDSLINPVFYVAAILPMILISFFAYILGAHDISLFTKKKTDKNK